MGNSEYMLNGFDTLVSTTYNSGYGMKFGNIC